MTKLREQRDAKRARIEELRKAERDALRAQNEPAMLMARAGKMYDRLIEEKKRQIASGEIRPVKKGRKTPSNPKIEGQRAELEALNEELANLRAIDKAQKQEAEYNRLIDAQDLRLPEKPPEGKAETPALARARLLRDAARKRLEKMRLEGGAYDEIRLRQAKIRGLNRIARLNEKAAAMDADTYKPPESPRPTPKDKEMESIDFQIKEAKNRADLSAEQMRRRHRTTAEKVFETAGEGVDLLQTVKASLDVSAVGRQGIFIGLGNPALAVRQIPAMIRAMRSPEGQYEVENSIRSDPKYADAVKAGLFFAGHGKGRGHMEEIYMSRYAQHIPGIGMSQRAYESYLNKIGFEYFKALVAKSEKNSGAKLSTSEMKQIAMFVNEAKGRGSFKKSLDPGLTLLNRVFFAPRLAVSRFQIMSGHPLWGGEHVSGTVEVRKTIAKEYAKALIGAAALYGTVALVKQAMGEKKDEWDLRSSEAGKIRVGDTRIDPLGGFLQSAVFLARMASGETKNQKGQIVPLVGDKVPFGKSEAKDVIANFMRSKLRPIAGATFDVATRKDFKGDWVTAGSTVENLIAPMTVSDIYQAMREEGVPEGAALGLLSVLGIGINTYEPNKPKGRMPPFMSMENTATKQMYESAVGRRK